MDTNNIASSTEASRHEALGRNNWWENEMKNRSEVFVSADGSPGEIVRTIIVELDQ